MPKFLLCSTWWSVWWLSPPDDSSLRVCPCRRALGTLSASLDGSTHSVRSGCSTNAPVGPAAPQRRCSGRKEAATNRMRAAVVATAYRLVCPRDHQDVIPQRPGQHSTEPSLRACRTTTCLRSRACARSRGCASLRRCDAERKWSKHLQQQRKEFLGRTCTQALLQARPSATYTTHRRFHRAKTARRRASPDP